MSETSGQKVQVSLGGGLKSIKLQRKRWVYFTLYPSHCPYSGIILGVVAMVYLRVTAEGCGDNGQALNDALEAPQLNPLNPGARDYAVAQGRQHYLQHQKQKQQRESGEQTKGEEEEREVIKGRKR